MDELIKIAISKLGELQQSPVDQNTLIQQYAKEAGVEWVNDKDTPWCSLFLNWCARKVNLKGSGKTDIWSWLLTGWSTFSPEPGDVVVIGKDCSKYKKGHVGIFMGFSQDGSQVYCIGGNDGHQVSLSSYLAEKVLGYQRLTYLSNPVLPEHKLKRGDVGAKVKELQNALKMTGFECGTSDGNFGNKTEAAVKDMQLTSRKFVANGIYDKNARDYLMVC